jgi:DNA-binding transcriptional regulator YhcF (GntR family)
MFDAPRTGYVKLHRKLLDYQWIGDPNVMAVFLQILLRVNREPKAWKGITIPRGSVLTSRDTLARACGLTEKQVRRALDCLLRAGTITTSRAGTGQLVSLEQWDEYQDEPMKQGRTRAEERAGRGPDEGRTRAATREGENLRRGEVEESPPIGGPPQPAAKVDEPPPVILWPSWAGDQTKAAWEKFKAYKKTQHRFQYKSIDTEQAAVNLLGRYFANGKLCVAALEEAMAKGHKFPVEPTAKFSGPSPKSNGVAAAIASAERKEFNMDLNGPEAGN